MIAASLPQRARFWLGYGANCLKEWLLAEGRMPPVRWIPWGSSWCYDLRRCFAAADKKSPRIIFDVGANIGQSALHLHGHFPQAQSTPSRLWTPPLRSSSFARKNPPDTSAAIASLWVRKKAR